MPKCCEKCGTHYIGLDCPGCLRSVNAELVKALEAMMEQAEWKRRCGGGSGESYGHFNAAMALAKSALARARG